MMQVIAFVALASSLLVPIALAEELRIQFPSHYRETFTTYLNLDRTQHPDQIIHLYVNDIALRGVRATGGFPDGSALVGEVYKAKTALDGTVIESQLGRRIRGNLALVAVMEKQKGWGAPFPPGLRNGDWDFAAFKPDGAVAEKISMRAAPVMRR